LAEIRANEMSAALAVLGVKEHTWMGYADGGCELVPVNEAVAKVKEQISNVRPDTIITFGPEGMTGHEDHKAVSRWVSLAVDAMSKKPAVLHSVNTVEQYETYLKPADEKLNIFFNIEDPKVIPREDCDLYFELPMDIRELKRRAMAAQPSQMERMLNVVAPDGVLNDGLAVEAFVLAEGGE
jgi:LmbE family N-acetylglucosaminyl deacetylase